MQNSVVDEKVALIDHAFTAKAQSDPAFRQALVLDPETAMGYYRTSARIQTRMRSALVLLDQLLGIIADRWAANEYLQQILGDTEARRVFLFAPEQASLAFELPPRPLMN